MRSIKLRSGTEYFLAKAQSGASSLKDTAKESQGGAYESETEYAGNQVLEKEKAVSKGAVSASEHIGKWGVRETTDNIYKWHRNRKAKKATAKTAKANRKMIKDGGKGIKRLGNTANSSAKAAKAGAKGTVKIAQKIKQAIIALIKNAKAIIKAIIAAGKAIVAAIKAIGAAIAAGGWIAVIILVICLVAIIGSSVYGVFTPANEDENVIASMMVELDAEYERNQENLVSEYDYDEIIYEGDSADWKDVVAVYAVRVNLDPENPQDLVTFSDAKSDVLKGVYSSMNTIRVETEERENKENGKSEKIVTVKVIREHLTANEAAERYNFTENQMEMLNELLDERNNELWQGLFASAY